MTYQERLKEIITKHAKEVLRVEADPFGKNVDWVKAGNRALAAINTLNDEMIGWHLPGCPYITEYSGPEGEPYDGPSCDCGVFESRQRFGIEEAV